MNTNTKWFTSLLLLLSLLVPTQGIHAETTLSKGNTPVRFGIVTFYNPRLMVLRYQPLMDALASRTGRPFELVLARNYDETVRQLEKGEIDIAYLGPVTFLRAHRKFGAIPLVRLNTGNSAVFHSVIAVRDDSEIASLEQLAGKRFAFGSPLSTSSHLFPRLIMFQAGVPPTELGGYVYFRHHDSAARAVLTGDADACGVRDVVANRYADRGLKVIAKSGPIPNFPLVVHPDASPELVRSLRDALLSFNPADSTDMKLLEALDTEFHEGFAEVSVEEYVPVEEIMKDIFGPKAYSGDPSLPGAMKPFRFGDVRPR